MSTTMTELDWQAAVAVFRASLPRRGAKGRNDRLFLEALHHHLASAAETRVSASANGTACGSGSSG